MKKWLPKTHLTELKEIKFDAVHPGNGQLNPRYTMEATIKAFLDKTTLEQSVDGKQLRVDYLGSSAGAPERPHLERAVSWFLRVTVRFKGGRNFQDVLADLKFRQETSLKAVSFIAYACSDLSGQESEHPGTIQVELLVHSKREIYRATLDRWLNCEEIEELECEAIRPGERKH